MGEAKVRVDYKVTVSGSPHCPKMLRFRSRPLQFERRKRATISPSRIGPQIRDGTGLQLPSLVTVSWYRSARRRLSLAGEGGGGGTC